jgi:cell wall-associated NlpC family hydrolase
MRSTPELDELAAAAAVAAQRATPSRRIKGGNRRRLCGAFFAAAMLGACSTTPQRTGQPVAAPEVVIQAMALLGTPYRYGGEDPATGMDCSGLVRYAYRRGASLDLPRRAEDMARVGTSVGSDELVPGDLVFFNTLGRPNSHVAIYIGDGRFVHAPAVRGVVRVEALGERYWDRRFNGARRVLNAVSAALPLQSSSGQGG